MNQSYIKAAQEREKQGIPPLPLTREECEELCRLLKNKGDNKDLLTLLENRIMPGVDPAAQVKADFLSTIAFGKKKVDSLSPIQAIILLGTMLGGYNIPPLLTLLEDSNEQKATAAAQALSQLILVSKSFDTVFELSKTNRFAKQVLESWAKADWFTKKEPLPSTIEGIIFKVDGEINTDDFSPASEAWSRADIPLHALSMGKTRFPNGLATMQKLKASGKPIFFVGDVVGTGSSRKSACNSLLWHIGKDIPFIPNKRRAGVILGNSIAPIFYNTAIDSGALPLICDVSKLQTGMEVTLDTNKQVLLDTQQNKLVSLEIDALLKKQYQAGGRVPYIIGASITQKARQALQMEEYLPFKMETLSTDSNKGFTLAQKIVGRACGMKGVLPNTQVSPTISSVGSQDTTGPMTRNEIMELACLSFEADFVLQTFCHTVAYPKPADIITHNTLPEFITDRQGVSLRPGDGIIHSWLNRLVLPDTVGTGGDSHTRIPIGISFPAGSGMVAFAAAVGQMPLIMPESVLVRFTGTMQEGITLRDIVNAIPYCAQQQGLLTVDSNNKKNIFNGRILEIEGLPSLTVEQAFELSDASAERSAAACTMALSKETIQDYLQSNIALIDHLISEGYKSKETLERRKEKMQDWLAKPSLLQADTNAEYAYILEINLNDIKEPLLACPNDPDIIKPLSEVAKETIDEVFIGSCMTNIGHFRSVAALFHQAEQAKTRLWVCPPTKMDEKKLKSEGLYADFSSAGARMEPPGCSLCMGNQARVKDNAIVFSTSTRNFNNRMGKGAQVYLGSAELGGIIARLGYIPSLQEYLSLYTIHIKSNEKEIYTYLDFSKPNHYTT